MYDYDDDVSYQTLHLATSSCIELVESTDLIIQLMTVPNRWQSPVMMRDRQLTARSLWEVLWPVCDESMRFMRRTALDALSQDFVVAGTVEKAISRYSETPCCHRKTVDRYDEIIEVIFNIDEPPWGEYPAPPSPPGLGRTRALKAVREAVETRRVSDAGKTIAELNRVCYATWKHYQKQCHLDLLNWEPQADRNQRRTRNSDFVDFHIRKFGADFKLKTVRKSIGQFRKQYPGKYCPTDVTKASGYIRTRISRQGKS